MQVKTFTGSSSGDVLAQVKAEMGPDAVILGNRTYRKNGVICHEITAGVERQTRAPASAEGDSFSGWGEWRKEWLQIKEQLFALMKPAIQMSRLTPRQRVALEYLQREGVSDVVSLELYKRLLAAPGSSILECLSEMVHIKAFSLTDWPQHIQMVVGPFGSGKTSTALRFALLLRKLTPGIRLAFINTDCLRGNGRILLRHWAELSNFIYLEAADAEAMHTILSKAAGLDLILIDTQGLAQGQNLPQILKNLGLMTEDIAIHLTLAPFANPVQIHEFLNRYKTGLPTSLVWTKLDEAVSFGNIVNVSYEAELPISALSFAGELQESLCPATEPLVWRLVFKRQIPGH
ncbi:MAG: flagellar biosynthesis protein FlhF [Desulfovibrionaceae bacterium]|nr:flagellar biosynthesis protein FlhF [Desulfovibrionaceae bacterium]